MAIALKPGFRLPNRSKQRVRRKKDDDGVIDIGWCEGVLSDGRGFRAELWAQDQIDMLTIFFSAEGLADLDQQGLQALVVREQLVAFVDAATTFCEGRKYVDDAGNELWSVNIVVGADRGTYVGDTVPFFPYTSFDVP